MKRLMIPFLISIVAALVFGCSGPSPEALKIEQQAKPVVKAFFEAKDAADNYDTFVAWKKKWEETGLSEPEADKLRKKLVQYLDMRIGVINGAPKMAANKAENEMIQMIKDLEKSQKIKLK